MISFDSILPWPAVEPELVHGLFFEPKTVAVAS
jgi:hypothetical protein